MTKFMHLYGRKGSFVDVFLSRMKKKKKISTGTNGWS